MSPKVVLLPGDGIGPSITDAVVRILAAAGADVDWETPLAGATTAESEGAPLPDRVLDAIRRTKVGLKGPLTTPVGKGFGSVNVRLRKELDLYASLRPVRTMPGVPSRYENVDITVVRENTEGLYSGIEHVVIPGVVESLKIMTTPACTRICRFAFEHAKKIGKTKVTALHKANIMKLADGLFLDCFYEVAKDYPELESGDLIIDAACMKLVMQPENFEVVVMENFYGDIVSDLCSGLVGGLGVTPGANIGNDTAVFEAVHGSAPDIAGLNMANPTALLQSAVMMLNYLGQNEVADRILAALEKTLGEGIMTGDLGGSAGTTEFTEAVVTRL